MGDFGRNSNRSGGGFRGGFGRGGRDTGRGGFGRGRSSFGGGRGTDRGGDRGPREMFNAVCDNCGKDCQVPFRPTGGKPVYCSDCFEKMGGKSDTGRNDFQRQDRPRFEPQAAQGINSAQIDALNAKLDKIISLLEPKQPEASTPEVKEAKPVRAKKTSVKKE